ncbi:phage tail assembly chaperone [Bilophila wadsworthia]
MAYRQTLRDLPQQPGFPWEGPDDPVCPWPAEPANVCAPVPHSCDAEGALQKQVSE